MRSPSRIISLDRDRPGLVISECGGVQMGDNALGLIQIEPRRPAHVRIIDNGRLDAQLVRLGLDRSGVLPLTLEPLGGGLRDQKKLVFDLRIHVAGLDLKPLPDHHVEPELLLGGQFGLQIGVPEGPWDDLATVDVVGLILGLEAGPPP